MNNKFFRKVKKIFTNKKSRFTPYMGQAAKNAVFLSAILFTLLKETNVNLVNFFFIFYLALIITSFFNTLLKESRNNRLKKTKKSFIKSSFISGGIALTGLVLLLSMTQKIYFDFYILSYLLMIFLSLSKDDKIEHKDNNISLKIVFNLSILSISIISCLLLKKLFFV